MKKILIVGIIVLCSVVSAWGGEFEDTLAAAVQGNAWAQNKLGWMYHKGQGVPQDYKQAVYWFTKAADQGDAWAQYNLGVAYDLGQGVPQNYKLAYVWYSLSAAQGEEKAIQNRDIVTKKLSPQLLSEAQGLAAKIQYRIDHPDAAQDQQPTMRYF